MAILAGMQRILVVADVPWVRNEVHAALTAPDFELVDIDDPNAAAATAVAEAADMVVVDLQVGSMGGMAVARDVRDVTGANDGERLPVLMLLDRAADTFLAKRAGAAAWLVKPFSSHEIRSAIAAVFVDETDTVAAPSDGA